MTQSAISHQIQKLEADLGVALFERRTRAIELTPEGRAYYEKVHAAFELLRAGTSEVRAHADERVTLTVGLLASFATRWLAPRLHAFSAAHPGIDLQLRPEIALADVSGGEVDVAIRYGRGGWPGVRSQQLMPERLSLVCVPSPRRRKEPSAQAAGPAALSVAGVVFETCVRVGSLGASFRAGPDPGAARAAA